MHPSAQIESLISFGAPRVWVFSVTRPRGAWRNGHATGGDTSRPKSSPSPMPQTTEPWDVVVGGRAFCHFYRSAVGRSDGETTPTDDARFFASKQTTRGPDVPVVPLTRLERVFVEKHVSGWVSFPRRQPRGATRGLRRTGKDDELTCTERARAVERK
jgi:hypothetical protein